MKKFFELHPEIVTISCLIVAFYFLFFHNIWTYPLMDVDETRYVGMARAMHDAKDYLTLYLNGEYFFEKPPLYFWLVSGSFALFHKVTEGVARFPLGICATLSCFYLYFCGRKAVSRKFGVFSSLILATSIEFIVLAKVAMLDMVLTTFIILSLYSGFMTFFVQDKNKKYFWWLFYIFSALAVMSKGIPGFIVPFGTMFFAGILTKRFKEYFRPQYLIVGFIVFFAIVIPWHYIMLKTYDPLFFNEYIVTHHLQRFMGGETLGRKRGAWYYLVTILWGFLPWIASFIAVLSTSFKKVSMAQVKAFDFNALEDSKKYFVLNIVGALFIFLFFTSSDTKLVTYILPIYACLACIVAKYWIGYVENEAHKKAINLSVYIFNGIFILAGVVAIFAKLFLPDLLYSDIKDVQALTVVIVVLFPLAGILFARKNLGFNVFLSYVCMFMALASFTGEYIKIDYKFGQNDLMNFAKYAKENNLNIVAYGMSRKYSLLYYADKKVDYVDWEDEAKLPEKLNQDNTILILRNSTVEELDGKLKFDVVRMGRRYQIVKRVEK